MSLPRPSLLSHLATAALAGILGGSAAMGATAGAGATGAGTTTALVYDREYPYIDYSGRPSHNDIARLEARLKDGTVHLEYREPAGYLASLLEALHIDPSSQTLVFSKTSLQAQAISPATPRAIYFNDDTYVGYVPHTGIIEITTMDSMLGAVFYTVSNQPAMPAHVERETLRCLSCHDSFSLMGGGVPDFLFLSAYSRDQGRVLTNTIASTTTDATPLKDRWGGWYVTGDVGHLQHLGNILPVGAEVLAHLPASRASSLSDLHGVFDTTPYLTAKSDAVALLVFEHQVYVHDLIIRSNYKSRMLLEKQTPGASTGEITWEQLSDITRQRMQALLEPLVRGLLLVDAAPFPNRIRGNAGFEAWFQAQGPRDGRGRSLRDLDLKTRLFRYPVSFLIYTSGFDELPSCARHYVYRRLALILSGRDTDGAYASLPPAQRSAAYEILSATRPEFARTAASVVPAPAPDPVRASL